MIAWHVDIGSGGAAVDGIRSALRAYCRALEGRGWQTEELTGAAGAQGLLAALREARALGRRARAERPTVVHLHSVYRPAHVLLAATLRRAQVPYVVSPHSGLSPASRRRDRIRKAVWIAVFERHYVNSAAAVAALTRAEARDVRSLCRRARCTEVPNAVPVPAQAAPVRELAATDRARLLMLGRYDVEQKGLDRLAVLAGQLPEVDVMVHGSADHNEPHRVEQLRALAPATFTLAPPVTGADKHAALAAADLYVQLSRWEGLSIAVLEAIAAGVPCVVSREVADTLDEHLRANVEVVPQDPARAAHVVRSLLRDTSRRAAMAAAGRAAVAERYSEARLADALVAAYGVASPGLAYLSHTSR